MLRASWTDLASQSVSSLIRRAIAELAKVQTVRRLRRGDHSFSPLNVAAEVLEIRQLLSVPTVMDDSFSVTHDHTLTVSSGGSVLNNDFNMGFGTMTAVQYTSPSHGTIGSFNSDGTFTYTPTSLWAGSDSFQYRAHNNDGYSSPATITISVNNAAPSVTGHSYSIYQDTQSVSAASGVLNGDSDSNGDTITATLVSSPSHAGLTLNGDGSFSLTPTAGYYGSDSYVVGVTDGIATTNETVNLTITNPFGAQTNATNTPFNDYSSNGPFSTSQLTGGVQVQSPLSPGGRGAGGEGDHTLVYSSLAADVKPIVIVDAAYAGSASGPPTPDKFKVDLTFGGLTASTLYFNNTGLGAGSATVVLADQIDASSLATGHYDYTMTVTAYYGSATSTRTYTGSQDIVNLQGSEFGKGWTLVEKDGLAVQTGGVLWYSGTGNTAWFASNGSGGFTSPAGPLNSSTLTLTLTLTLSAGVYTLTDKLGNVETFTSAGLLSSRVDTNGNTTGYSYTSGKLSSITDPYGRTTSFSYTSGLVSAITDIASQTTTLAHSGTNLTSITAPIPAGGVAGPVTGYAYTGNLLTTITDPDSNATSLAYSYGDRIDQATFADSTTNGFSPAEMAGLVNTTSGTGTSFSTPATPDVITSGAVPDSSTTDAMSHTSTILVDQWGNVLSNTDPLSLTTTWVFNSNDQVTQMTQPNPGSGAPVTGWTYDSNGNLLTLTHPDNTTDTWTYGTSGGSLNRPLTHTDQRGKTTTMTYDGHGNMLTSTDALSNVTTLTYNSDGTVATITLPNPSTGAASGGLVTSFTYDSDARVTRVTNPDSTHKDFTYDSEDNLLTSTDELGRVTSFAYDGDGRQVAETLPNPSTGGASGGLVTHYAYDAASNLTSVTDPMVYVTSYGFNSRNWQTTITLPVPATGVSAPVYTIGYNANGWQTTQTDALGNVTTTAYDADGRVTSVTQPDPDGSGPLSAPVTNYTLDNLGRVTAVEDPNGHYTDYGYNSVNEITSVTDALGKATDYTFDATGNVLTVTVPNPSGSGAGPVTTYAYSDVGQLLTTTDPMGNVTTNAFDHDGRLITVTAPVPATGVSAPVTSYTYDSLSRLSTETDPRGNITTLGYDAAGELTSVTVPNPSTGGATGGPVTTYAFDGDGRQTSVTNPDSKTTTTAYNDDGQVTSVTDADSNITSYGYDHDGNNTSVTDANANTQSDTFDADGQVTSQTDKKGQLVDFSYDHDGRMTQENWMSGGTPVYTANYAYDAGSNLTSASDNNSAYAYTYNADNSNTQVDNSGTPTGPHVVLNIGYDNMQRETSLSATVGGTADFLNNYSYNTDSQVTQITQQGQTGGNAVASKLVNFTFDHDGRLTVMSRYANLGATQLVAASTYGYNADSAPTSLSQDKGATNANSYTWSYDHDGRVTGDTSIDGTDSYSYDAASQLTAATHSYETNESYSFDNTGNRTNTGYSTGANNQLSSDGTYNYLYDANGNMTKKTTISTGTYVTYTWDYHNRLTDVEAYNSSNVLQSHIRYTYDVFDRLIEKQVDPTGGGTYTDAQSFVYDDSDNVILIYNGSGGLTDRLLYGPSVNQVLADENGSGTVSWLLADDQGTIRDVVQYNSGTDTTTIVDHLEYNSFGVITSQSNSAYQPIFAYTGQMWDAAAGLYYYHARWYDAATGRFISQDPTGFAAGDPNLYRYVANDPENFVDPTGQSFMSDIELMMKYKGDALDGAATGAGHGAAMVANAATGGLITPLDNHVNDLIEQNGGAYAYANMAANIGVGAATAALPCGLLANGFRAINGAAGARDLLSAIQAGDAIKAGMAAMALLSAMMGTGRCFVAGTPIAVGWDYEPIYVGQFSETATNGDVGEIHAGWMIAGLGIVAMTVYFRSKRRQEEHDMQNTRLVFANGKFSFEPVDDTVGQPVPAWRYELTPKMAGVRQGLTYRDRPLAVELNQSHNLLTEPRPMTSLKISTAPKAADPARSVVLASDATGDARLSSNRPSPAARPQIRNPKSKFRNLLCCLPLLLAGLCFWQALPAARAPVESTATASITAAAPPKAAASRKRTLVTRPIEEIQVGQRVLAENPELRGADVPEPTIDSETTRLVVLHQVKPDGDDVTIETLLSLEELLAVAIARLESDEGELSIAILPEPLAEMAEGVSLSELLVGHVLDVHIAELGVDGPAEIVAVHPCPPIEPDDGTGRRLVTSVFRHSAANVVDVCTTGTDRSIGTTGNHPFWSVDRQEFIPAGDLRPGENLRRADGTLAQVIRITPRRGPPVPVFNFEVDGQHVYSVGADGLLVHNAYKSPAPSGSYTITFANGMQYYGKGLKARAITSAKRLATLNGTSWTHNGIDWKQARDTIRAFMEEARRIRTAGSIGKGFGNYNKINSPGESILRARGI